MKRWIALIIVTLLGLAAIVLSERRKVDVSASPEALLYLVADTEQELTRMPVNFTRMSDVAEIRIGDELVRSYAAGERQSDDAEAATNRTIEQYLTRVGMPLTAHLHRKLPYKFHYLPLPYFVNAFALPGGHVYIGEGLLSVMDSEDELAAVLGHELEHIDHYHCAERVQQEEALRKIPLGELVALPIEVFTAGYSKDQELEADREGTRLAVEAGYSANGAIRMFETFARFYDEVQAKAKTPQDEASQMVLQTLEGYFRSHPLPAERIAQIQRLIASEGWTPHAERDLAIAYFFLTVKAEDALQAHKYPQAEHLAAESLRLQAGQLKALRVLARAQFAQANFSAAAEAYRKVLFTDPSQPELIAIYAQSLAAADRKSAITEFRRWESGLKGEKSADSRVADAGLALLAGEPEPAQRLGVELLRPGSDPQIPERAGELGWWFYLAGNYDTSANLLSSAEQLRPGGPQIRLRLAWTQMELRRYSDAMQVLQTLIYEPTRQPEINMARAVVHWLAQDHDEALIVFNAALHGQPEWENPNWVRALYSPQVAQAIQEMLAERARRAQKAKSAAAR
jgi:beta-barrel assembly-enhancing protease